MALQIPAKMKVIYFLRHLFGNETLLDQSAKRIHSKTARRLSTVAGGGIEGVQEIDRRTLRPHPAAGSHLFQTPFVMRRFLDGPAFDFSEVNRIAGSTTVPVHTNARKGKSWQYGSIREMQLGAALDAISSGEPLSVVSTSQPFLEFPELREMTKGRQVAELFGTRLFRQEMFVGGEGASSAFHCAPGGNFFLMASGSKRWVFVAPEDSFGMYPSIGRSVRSAFIGSPVDSTKNSEHMSRYPLYLAAKKYEVTLEPGDLLYNPSWWWHEVTNLTPAIGVPMRSMIRGRNRFFFTLMLFSRYGAEHIPKALISSLLGPNASGLMSDRATKESFGSDS